jgi:hypothetical protein
MLIKAWQDSCTRGQSSNSTDFRIKEAATEFRSVGGQTTNKQTPECHSESLLMRPAVERDAGSFWRDVQTPKVEMLAKVRSVLKG